MTTLACQDAVAGRPRARYPWALLLVLGVGAAAAALALRAYFVDDAFTGFRYLENLLSGKGFVFYPGQTPVEGVTNIGWLLLLLPLAAAIGPTLGRENPWLRAGDRRDCAGHAIGSKSCRTGRRVGQTFLSVPRGKSHRAAEVCPTGYPNPD